VTTPETVHAVGAEQVIADCRTFMDLPLRNAVASLPASLQLVVGYHFGWHDEGGHPAKTYGGNAIRPTFALLSAKAVGADARAALPAAVAVELVHNFSLLHDDVIDGDRTRQRRPTAWAVYGIPAAILAGDALLTLAFGVVAGCSRSNAAACMLSTALIRLVDGQNADLALEKRAAVTVPESVEMTAGKTAALLGCACALGATFGGASPDQVELLRIFGEQLGLAFQHTDDLLGIWGDPAVTGKPAYSDLANRKKSLPVTAALVSGTAAARELADLYSIERPLADTELARAAALVEEAGGRAWGRSQAEDHLATALHWLLGAGFEEQATEEIVAVARLVAHRDP
jgi:geranylgeranyl diphosphate synthase type I